MAVKKKSKLIHTNRITFLNNNESFFSVICFLRLIDKYLYHKMKFIVTSKTPFKSFVFQDETQIVMSQNDFAPQCTIGLFLHWKSYLHRKPFFELFYLCFSPIKIAQIRICPLLYFPNMSAVFYRIIKCPFRYNDRKSRISFLFENKDLLLIKNFGHFLCLI